MKVLLLGINRFPLCHGNGDKEFINRKYFGSPNNRNEPKAFYYVHEFMLYKLFCTLYKNANYF